MQIESEKKYRFFREMYKRCKLSNRLFIGNQINFNFHFNIPHLQRTMNDKHICRITHTTNTKRHINCLWKKSRTRDELKSNCLLHMYVGKMERASFKAISVKMRLFNIRKYIFNCYKVHLNAIRLEEKGHCSRHARGVEEDKNRNEKRWDKCRREIERNRKAKYLLDIHLNVLRDKWMSHLCQQLPKYLQSAQRILVEMWRRLQWNRIDTYIKIENTKMKIHTTWVKRRTENSTI